MIAGPASRKVGGRGGLERQSIQRLCAGGLVFIDGPSIRCAHPPARPRSTSSGASPEEHRYEIARPALCPWPAAGAAPHPHRISSSAGHRSHLTLQGTLKNTDAWYAAAPSRRSDRGWRFRRAPPSSRPGTGVTPGLFGG